MLGRDEEDRIAPAFPNAPIWVQSLEAREARDEPIAPTACTPGDAFDRLEALGLIREVDGQAEVTPECRVI